MDKTRTKADWQRKSDAFWSAWPPRITESGRSVKLNRVAAEVWFRVNKPDDALFEQIMAQVEAYKKAVQPKWYQDAFRWLGKRRWMDDYGEAMPRRKELVCTCYDCGRQRYESEMEKHPVATWAHRCKGGCP